MTRYNVAIYGTGVKYGPSQQAEFQVPEGGFTATINLSAGSGGYTIQWTPPGGSFTAFRLVRNFQNIPADENDGDILTTVNSGIHQETGLPQGSFVYYSIFVQDPSTEWFRAGDLVILVTRDWGYSDLLYDRLPQFYQARDESLIDPHSTFLFQNLEIATKGPLRRFLQVIGGEFDTIRTEYETLRLTSDSRNIGGGLLPLLAKSLGLEFESELGMRRNREFIENAIHYYKLKGTFPGVEGIVSAVTGWDDSVYIGHNIMLDNRDSTFQLGVVGALTSPYGTWQMTAGNGLVTLTDETAKGFLSAISGFDTQFLQIQGQGGTGTFGTFKGGLIPVVGLTNITFSIYTRSDVSGSGGQVGLEFFNKYRTSLGSFSLISFVSTGTAWSRQYHTAPVPAGAYFVRPVYVYENFTARTHWIDFAQVESDTVPTVYERPRTIHIKLRADRINKVQNPSLETGLFGWSALTNCTLGRVTTLGKSGAAAGRAQSTAPGAMEWGTGVMPVTGGLRYAASVWFRPAVTPQMVGCGIVWVNAAGLVLSILQSADVLEVASDWVRPGVVGVAPALATSAYILCRTASTSGAGEQHYWDAALFEQAESVRDYFDASKVSTNGEYLWENGGSAHTVPSHFYSKRLIKRARLLAVLPKYLPVSASFTLEFAKNP